MAIAVWPSSVNQYAVRESYREVPDQNVAQFSPDVGPPKLRRRMSISTDKLALDIIMTGTEYATFLTFWRTHLKDGTLPFAFTRPRTQAVEAFNFTAPPQVQDWAYDKYRLSLAMQQAPGYDGVNLQNGNDQYTKILLHYEGTDASTVITESAYGQTGARSWTARGAAQIDNAAFKFGATSLVCPDAASYSDTPDHPDFTLGSGDFTVDGWFRAATNSTDLYFAGQCDVAGGANANTAWYMGRFGNTNSHRIACSVVQGTTVTTVTGTTAVNIAKGQTHVEFVRTGNVLKLFIDGVQEGGNVAFTGAVNDSTGLLGVGSLGNFTTATWWGWVDEFRLSVGIARHTANFTPATAAYS